MSVGVRRHPILDARAIGFPEPVTARLHVVHFSHPKGELPDGFFFCPACNRLIPFASWMTKVCAGGAA